MHAPGHRFPHTSFPPFALHIVVLDAGAVLIVTVTVGRFVIVDVVLTMVYFVLVFVGVGCEILSAWRHSDSGKPSSSLLTAVIVTRT